LIFDIPCSILDIPTLHSFQNIIIFAVKKKSMEEWQLEYEWLRVRHVVKKSMGKTELPNLNNILFLIGIQELGRFDDKFSKEEKQDLMHVAVCTLLEPDGYFKFKGRDADGWPHFDPLRQVDIEGVASQEELLKVKVIEYFKNLNDEEE